LRVFSVRIRLLIRVGLLLSGGRCLGRIRRLGHGHDLVVAVLRVLADPLELVGRQFGVVQTPPPPVPVDRVVAAELDVNKVNKNGC
jgi:hypothetical protein